MNPARPCVRHVSTTAAQRRRRQPSKFAADVSATSRPLDFGREAIATAMQAALARSSSRNSAATIRW